MGKEPGLVAKSWTRTSSVLDNSMGTVDETLGALHTGSKSLNPIALEFLNDSKAELVTSIVTLAKARKSAEKELLEIGYTAKEVAQMLAPVN